jgi:1,2-diacylglycerol 3-beta-glucosyltransferase
MTALIVEDEAIIVLSLRRQLLEAGFEICAAVATGEDAVEAVRESQPTVVLMDILLAGEMDGLQAAREIRSISNAAIVFTTGYQDPKIRAEALALSPLGYLNKPVTRQSLEAVLSQL